MVATATVRKLADRAGYVWRRATDFGPAKAEHKGEADVTLARFAGGATVEAGP